MVVAFSASNRYVYSGGADDVVCKYSMTSTPTNSINPLYHCEQYRQHSVCNLSLVAIYSHLSGHQDMVRGIAPHPYQDEVFLSAR